MLYNQAEAHPSCHVTTSAHLERSKSTLGNTIISRSQQENIITQTQDPCISSFFIGPKSPSPEPGISASSGPIILRP